MQKAALAVASTETPSDYTSWTKHGVIFPEIKWSKSGAVIVREEPPHYMIWGDSSFVPGLHVSLFCYVLWMNEDDEDKTKVSTSEDLIHWTAPRKQLLIETRSTMFDSNLVESG